MLTLDQACRHLDVSNTLLRKRARTGRSRWKQRAADRWTLKLPNTDRAEE